MESMHPAKRNSPSSREADKFVVRFPEGMRERISEVSKTYHRSMNSEIVARLEESLATENGAAAVDINAASLSQSERQLLQRFRSLANVQQRALLDIISPALIAEEEPLQAKCA